MGPPPSSSNLDSLLAAWGLEFDTSKVVADRSFAREIAFQRGAQPQMQPCFLFVDEQGINSSDVVTSQTDQLMLPFRGVYWNACRGAQANRVAALDRTITVSGRLHGEAFG